MYQPDETIRLEVRNRRSRFASRRMDHETVWLTTRQMAILFGREESNIRRHVINVFKEKELSRENNVQILHVNNIYKTGELEQESTCAKIAQVQIEGKRTIKRMILYFNLDMIISVGYRVNSKRGVKFRQWAAIRHQTA